MTITKDQLRVLRHAIGLNPDGTGHVCNPCAPPFRGFRNTVRMNSIARDTMYRYDSYIATRNPEQAT